MKLSIIIPVFNVEQYIRRCLDSIIPQIDNSDEIIVINDGSTDSSGTICDHYAKTNNVHVIHKSNGGLSDARNNGIDYASGDYLIFIDSDDYVSADYIYQIKSVLSQHKYDIVNFGYNIVDINDVIKTTHHLSTSCPINPAEALNEILFDNNINNFAWANVYRRSLFEKIRYPVGVLYEDKYTTYKLFSKASSFFHIASPLYNYVVREGSICNSNNIDRKLKGAFDNIGGLIQQYNFAYEKSLQTCVANLSNRINACSISLCRTLYKNKKNTELHKLKELLIENFTKDNLRLELKLFTKHPIIYNFIMEIYRRI